MEQARRLSLREQGRNIGCGAPLSGSIVAQPRIHKATLSHALLHKVDPSLVEPGPYRANKLFRKDVGEARVYFGIFSTRQQTRLSAFFSP